MHILYVFCNSSYIINVCCSSKEEDERHPAGSEFGKSKPRYPPLQQVCVAELESSGVGETFEPSLGRKSKFGRVGPPA